jgi:hypothetical protein
MKMKVPNIFPHSGVSTDFARAYGSLSYYLECIEEEVKPRTKFLSKRSFFHRSIPRYDELFSPNEYAEVVTKQNQKTVESLNKLVDQLNILRQQELPDFKELSVIHKNLNRLIIGNKK